MSNLIALHDFLHLYLLTKENSLLYFQGNYAQLLKQLILPDKALLTQYLNHQSNCSKEEFNRFAEAVIKHILFNSEHVLFNLVRNNGISYTTLIAQPTEDVQAPVISLVQSYPQSFLSVMTKRQAEQRGGDGENAKRDSSMNRDRGGSSEQVGAYLYLSYSKSRICRPGYCGLSAG